VTAGRKLLIIAATGFAVMLLTSIASAADVGIAGVPIAICNAASTTEFFIDLDELIPAPGKGCYAWAAYSRLSRGV
jgi:hypothetical protein